MVKFLERFLCTSRKYFSLSMELINSINWSWNSIIQPKWKDLFYLELSEFKDFLKKFKWRHLEWMEWAFSWMWWMWHSANTSIWTVIKISLFIVLFFLLPIATQVEVDAGRGFDLRSFHSFLNLCDKIQRFWLRELSLSIVSYCIQPAYFPTKSA